MFVESLNQRLFGLLAMHYAYDANNQLSYMYGYQGALPLGEKSLGSYNTFLNQRSMIVVRANQNIEARYQVLSNGSVISSGSVSLLANQTRVINPVGLTNNSYGRLEVNFEDQSGNAVFNAASAWFVRQHPSDYLLAFPGIAAK